MSYPLSGVSLTAKIKEVAKLMITKKSRLAVFDVGTLVGIITASDLIKSLPDVPETEIKVDDFMTKQVVKSDEETSVLDIAKIMGKGRIGSVIITRKGEPSGFLLNVICSQISWLKAKRCLLRLDQHVHSHLSSFPLAQAFMKTAAIMALKHVRRLPIVRGEKLVGIITARDLVEAYAK